MTIEPESRFLYEDFKLLNGFLKSDKIDKNWLKEPILRFCEGLY
jgi:hypothetical protein